MRKIVLQEFISLDGVIQAPGRPDEDTSDGFNLGGWTAPYFYEADEEAGDYMQRHLVATDLLLGRKTYEIFAGYWPQHAEMWPGIQEVNKYVVSNGNPDLSWVNSKLLSGDVVKAVEALKEGEGSVLKVMGSSQLAQTLLENGLVDEINLMIFPVILGKGKRLFGAGSMPAAFEMKEQVVTANGVVFTDYVKAGQVRTGIVGQ